MNCQPPYGNPPKPFSGRRDASKAAFFLARMQNHMIRFNFQDDLDKITHFSSDFLEGEAAQWYFALARSGIRNSTVKEFLVSFQRKYYNSNAIDDVMDRMFNCCQESTLTNYNSYSAELAAVLPTDMINEKARMSKNANCQNEPMDVDPSHREPKNIRKQKLSPKERQLLKKLGIWFRCRAGQHKASQCPNVIST